MYLSIHICYIHGRSPAASSKQIKQTKQSKVNNKATTNNKPQQ